MAAQEALPDQGVSRRMVGRRLKLQREWRNMKAKAVAEQAGVAASGVSDVENGKRQATAEYLAAVVPVLWEHGSDGILRDLLVAIGAPLPRNYLRDLNTRDPLEDVTDALFRGPWPEKVAQAVLMILEPWTTDSSGRTVPRRA